MRFRLETATKDQLTELALKLDAIRRADRLAAIEERAWLAFIAGAEEETRRSRRRGLTADELAAVLAQYPGHPIEPPRSGSA